MVTKKYFTLGISGQKELGEEFDFLELSILKDVTKTVGSSGADHTTLEAAVESFNDSYLGDDCQISLITPGPFSANDFDSVQGFLEIVGDTRSMAGHSFVNGETIKSPSANAGSGTCTITKTGAQQLTVTGSGGNPDFGADGWGNGDECRVGSSLSGSPQLEQIDSVSGNVINFTSTVDDPNGSGGNLIMIPNKAINASFSKMNSPFLKIKLRGIDITENDPEPSLDVSNGAILFLENCFVRNVDGENILCDGGFVFVEEGTCTFNDSAGVVATNSGVIICRNSNFITPNSADSNVKAQLGAIINCEESFFSNVSLGQNIICESGGKVLAKDSKIYCHSSQGDGVDCRGNNSHVDLENSTIDSVSVGTGDGVTVFDGGNCRLVNATINNFAIGLNVENGSEANITGGGCTNCTTGIRANRFSYVNATNTNANMSGNTTDYDPATSDVEGNVNSIITNS